MNELTNPIQEEIRYESGMICLFGNLTEGFMSGVNIETDKWAEYSRQSIIKGWILSNAIKTNLKSSFLHQVDTKSHRIHPIRQYSVGICYIQKLL